MGMIRKATAFSTLGLVNHRSPRERQAHAAQVAARAERKKSRTDSKLAKAEIKLLEAQKRLLDL